MSPTPRTLRLAVEYDGTDFCGWQRQPAQRSVQACLEDAFLKMTGQAVMVRGAGRTDAGVHADAQVASVSLTTGIAAATFVGGLNNFLPQDIAVLSVDDVPEAFDARRSARGKIYRYTIWNHPIRSPAHARRSWHQRAPLDTQTLRRAAQVLVGEHDFRGFRAADCERLSTIRIIRRFEVQRMGSLITFEVEGTAFLKNMVRIMVGTVAAVGHGKMTVDQVREILSHGDRTRGGITAPAHGLTLAHVIY